MPNELIYDLIVSESFLSLDKIGCFNTRFFAGRGFFAVWVSKRGSMIDFQIFLVFLEFNSILF